MKIIRTKRYLKDMKRIGASADDISTLELEIATNPQKGDVIPKLGGIRKIRFKLGNKGKSGGGRAIYFLMVSDEMAILLFAYAKNQQTDLTNNQRKVALALIKELKND